MKWKKQKLLSLLGQAQQLKTMSKDGSTKIAVFILDEEYTVRSQGYNGFPRGINDDVAERHERPEKYFWFEHAERNGIYNAIRSHADIRNCWMLMTCGMPCTDCARAIIQVGLKGIIMPDRQWTATAQEIWKQNAIRSEQMFDEAGVQYLYIEDMDKVKKTWWQRLREYLV